MKTALVVGCQGQDGRLMTELLRKKKYRILGLGRNYFESTNMEWSRPVNIIQPADVGACIKQLLPDEIYYFAAQHDSSEAPDQLNADTICAKFNVNTFGPAYFLESMKEFSHSTRFFYASSCLIYEESEGPVQSEASLPNPTSTYALTKFAAQRLCRQFRENFGLFASVGVMYNHESSLRPKNFVSQRIIQSALDIEAGRINSFEIGNLETEVDWGYAPDFVDACWRVLQLQKPDDYIIATGKPHRVEDFVSIAFQYIGEDWKKWVRINPCLTRKKRNTLIGDPSKIMRATGWTPSVNFRQMIKILLDEGRGQQMR